MKLRQWFYSIGARLSNPNPKKESPHILGTISVRIFVEFGALKRVKFWFKVCGVGLHRGCTLLSWCRRKPVHNTWIACNHPYCHSSWLCSLFFSRIIRNDYSMIYFLGGSRHWPFKEWSHYTRATNVRLTSLSGHLFRCFCVHFTVTP